MGAGSTNQKKGAIAMMQTCYFCKGTVLSQPTTVDFWWGDDLKIIEQVPAGVCQQCGEKYFDGHVYQAMERLVQEPGAPIRRLSIDVMRYSAA
ncbi:MAG: YgiT-type zinc finger protein [Nitrospira sp. CR2.1]|nr:YgiT-type zinc finger protein [Nitrospira sp. CR2.1]